MDACMRCYHWTCARVTQYSDGTTTTQWRAVEGQGACSELKIETAAEFGCKRFAEGGGDHVDITVKAGHPWQHFTMGPCPECRGGGSHLVETRPACYRCAGTGKVRHYEDGFIGEERTRRHPNEIEKPPTCAGCGKTVNLDWRRCPWCGHQLYAESETELVASGVST